MIRTPDFERAGKRNISQNPFSRNWPSTSIKETILLQGVPISILRNEHFRLVLRFSGIQQPQLNLLIQTKHLQYTRVPPRKPFGVLKKKQCGDPFMDLFFLGDMCIFFSRGRPLTPQKVEDLHGKRRGLQPFDSSHECATMEVELGFTPSGSCG